MIVSGPIAKVEVLRFANFWPRAKIRNFKNSQLVCCKSKRSP